MKDYFALLTESRKLQGSPKIKPSKPSKGAYEGNDGLVDRGFQNFVPTKFNISASPQIFATLWHPASDADRYRLDERVAIYEYEAGFTRQEAEAKAAAEFQPSKEME